MRAPRSAEVVRRFLAGEGLEEIALFRACRRRSCGAGLVRYGAWHGHWRGGERIQTKDVEDILRRAMLRGEGRGK